MKFFKQSFTGYMVKYTTRKCCNADHIDLADKGYLIRRLNSAYKKKLLLSPAMKQVMGDIRKGDSVLVNETPYIVTHVDKHVFAARQIGKRNGENMFLKCNGVCLQNQSVRARKYIRASSDLFL